MTIAPLVRRLALAAALGLPGLAAAQAPTPVEVWKTPTCGCCEDWVKHMRDNGFAVTTHDVSDTGPIRRNAGMADHGSCHTAVVGGYAIEGHVPASDVRRLLLEKPEAAGLAAPGMPLGSPGMDGPDMADARRRTTCCWWTSAAARRCSRPIGRTDPSLPATDGTGRGRPGRPCRDGGIRALKQFTHNAPGFSLHRSKMRHNQSNAFPTLPRQSWHKSSCSRTSTPAPEPSSRPLATPTSSRTPRPCRRPSCAAP